ncbi:hypothetical protein PSTG_17613, partial [Puccinia striiformis f. sp. tritici PST-78]
MVAPSSDSRIRLTRAAQAPKKRAADTTSDSGQSTTASQAKSKAKSKAKKNQKNRTAGRASEAATVLDKKKGTRRKSKKKQKKNGSLEGVSADSEGEDEAHDYNQDTDQESIEIQPRDAKAAKLKEFADILDFFEAPFKKPGDKSKKPVNFTCKWCKTPYRAHGTTKGNLYAHRDGSTQADKNPNGCVNRMKAKRSGIKLPPSVAEQRILDAKDASAQTSIMDHFQAKPAFVNRVLNQMIMIWQVRQALPWTRIEDPYLRAAFIYSNTKAVLYARRWAADESKKLYSMLKSHVFEELKALDTKFTLIHDVWTTKGNRFAFIGASVAFVDHNWEHVVRHLSLKMIPWKHNGHLLARPIIAILKKEKLYEKITQTTDSGSNNNTMASHMYELLIKDIDSILPGSWDPSSMHIKCICHKFALIVNAGLQALALKTLPPMKAKASVLGFFPVLGRLTEEDEDESSSIQVAPEEPAAGGGGRNRTAITIDLASDSESDYGNADDELSDNGQEDLDEDDSVHETGGHIRHSKTVKLKELTERLDVVIKQITRSAAQRSNFQLTAQKLNLKVAPLIAGYGIRWNIRYQSYQKAIDAREVIDRILKEDQENNSSETFSDAYFSPRDWKELDNLNRELEVYVQLTSQMEGNSSTATHVLPKYLELKECLTAKIEASDETDALYPMYQAMLKRVDKYLDEAMECDTLVIATIMHPMYRMHIFELAFGTHSHEVTNCLERLQKEYEIAKQKFESITPPESLGDIVEIEKPSSAPPGSLMARLASKTAKPSATTQVDEIQAYLNAELSFREGDINHKTTPLMWWKANQKTYPALAIMARSYLGAVGTSCAVERTFSAAADVCSSNRGRLLPSNMSHL